MAEKLTKFKLFCKKYWIYILLVFAFLFSFVFAAMGAGKDNVWFKSIKKLMGMLNDTQDKLQEIHQRGQKKEDDIRHDQAAKVVVINDEAKKEQDANLAARNEEVTRINEETKDNPDKMAEEFKNAFGIPEGKNQ